MFLRWYGKKQAIIEGAGLVSGRLHRSLEADAKFNFINVVEWENLYNSKLHLTDSESSPG
jgi:hypothetical protein